MREFSKILLLLIILPMIIAVAAVLTTSKLYILPPILFPPLITLVIALSLDEKPTISITLNADKSVMYVDEELNIELNVKIHGGFGLLIIRAPPNPDTLMAEGFELVKGNNVHVIFKGFGDVDRRFTYVLKAVKRGGNYSLGSIDYVYYNALGIHEPIKGSIKLGGNVQVIPRIKIVRRVLGMVKPRQGLPRYSPSSLAHTPRNLGP